MNWWMDKCNSSWTGFKDDKTKWITMNKSNTTIVSVWNVAGNSFTLLYSEKNKRDGGMIKIIFFIKLQDALFTKEISSNLLNIHSLPITTYPAQGHWEAWAFPNCHWTQDTPWTVHQFRSLDCREEAEVLGGNPRRHSYIFNFALDTNSFSWQIKSLK